jgi:hypothetical protein
MVLPPINEKNKLSQKIQSRRDRRITYMIPERKERIELAI